MTGDDFNLPTRVDNPTIPSLNTRGPYCIIDKLIGFNRKSNRKLGSDK